MWLLLVRQQAPVTPPHHSITSSLHHLVTSSPRHFITSSLHHFFCKSIARSLIVGSALSACFATLCVGVCGSRSVKSTKRGTFIAASRARHQCAISPALSVAPGLGTIATRIS